MVKHLSGYVCQGTYNRQREGEKVLQDNTPLQCCYQLNIPGKCYAMVVKQERLIDVHYDEAVRAVTPYKNDCIKKCVG